MIALRRSDPRFAGATPRRRLSGLSLVELMISITLGLMVLAAVVTVFANASSARSEIERTSRQIENGRFAAETLSDDLRVAGYYGELDVGALAAPGTLPADPCSVTQSDWEAAIPLHVQGYDNGAGFSSTICTLANRKSNTDILLVRRVRGCAAGVAGCDAAVNGKPYVQVSMCATEITTHRLGLEGSTTFDLTKKDCTSAAAKRQYYVNIYYISTDNGAGQSIPTLTRLELTGSGWTTVPLVEGIEEFNVIYGLDTDGDGAPDVYAANPNDYPAGACTGACPINNWMNAVTAQFHIIARNLETSTGYTDSKTYTIGIDASGSPLTVTPGGGYRRHAYSGLVRVNNPAGRRDTP